MSERNSARTKLIGLRRLPQPPMPSVIPLSSEAIAWVSEINLLRISDTVTDRLSYFFYRCRRNHRATHRRPPSDSVQR